MTPLEVHELVHAQIADQWHRSNLHHVDLRRCLVEPPRLMTFIDPSSETPCAAWLVFHEDPESERGYGVVFDESSGECGLAQFAEGYEPCLFGIYGDFFAAFEAM